MATNIKLRLDSIFKKFRSLISIQQAEDWIFSNVCNASNKFLTASVRLPNLGWSEGEEKNSRHEWCFTCSTLQGGRKPVRSPRHLRPLLHFGARADIPAGREEIHLPLLFVRLNQCIFVKHFEILGWKVLRRWKVLSLFNKTGQKQHVFFSCEFPKSVKWMQSK